MRFCLYNPSAPSSRPTSFWLTGLLVGLLLNGLFAVAWSADEDVLKDPIALGAWLYQGHCTSCHSDYASERLASEYDDEAELAEAISQGGCKVDWARQYGGKLRRNEIAGLAKYMLAWEEEDSPPPLPELPPQPGVELESLTKKKKTGYVLPQATKEVIPSALKALMESNPVAHGAWLYVKHCFRCHLDYSTTRMGRGWTAESIENTITNGKTSTQMLPFSNLLGGNLTRSQIKAITTYITTWEKFQEPLAISARLLKPPAADPSALKPIPMPKFARVTGDAQAARDTFRLNCQRCHGPSGEGYIGPRLDKTWYSLRPDLLVKSIVKTGVPGGIMPAWDQSLGGPLSAKQIADITMLVVGWSSN